jgi:aminoglycoside phosphotransferase
LPDAPLLGRGGEGAVYDRGDGRVVKLYGPTTRAYLESVATLQRRVAGAGLPYATPLIEEIGEDAGGLHTVERRLSGRTLDALYAHLNEHERSSALRRYLEAVWLLNQIELPDAPFGQLVETSDRITADTWPGFVRAKLGQRGAISQRRLPADVPGYHAKLERLDRIVAAELDESSRRVVHADYYLNNVLVDESLRISAVLDLSAHAVAGDPAMDAAGAIAFLPLHPAYRPGHAAPLYELADSLYGLETRRRIEIYRAYYGFYFSDLYRYGDEAGHRWVVASLAAGV